MQRSPFNLMFQAPLMLFMALAALLFTAPTAMAREHATPTLTMADGAYPYIRFERLLGTLPRDPERLAPLQRNADIAVGALFGRDMERALRLLDDAVLRELTQAEPTTAHLAAAGLSVQAQGTPINNLTLTSRYGLGHATESVLSYMLRVRSPKGRLQWQYPLELPASPEGFWTVDFPIQLGRYDVIDEPGPLNISLLCEDGTEIPIGQVDVYPQRLNELREAHNNELAKAAPLAPELHRSVSRFSARNNQLREFRHPNRLADHLMDRTTLALQLEDEMASLMAGEDPYRNAVGDRWFLIESAQGDLPYRLYAPTTALHKDLSAPVPVVIALHGMGGNEHLFMDGYGGGSLKTLANEHGFLLVSPRTYELANSADFLDALLEDVADMYTIDHERVYLIGHSLGAMTSMTLAAQRPDDITAICAIAGDGRVPNAESIPPTLAYLAEKDWMVPSDSAAKRIQKAQQNGINIRSRLVPLAGHLLVVHMVLPEAIAWLMEQHTPAQ